MNSYQVDIKMLDACYNLLTSLFKNLLSRLELFIAKV